MGLKIRTVNMVLRSKFDRWLESIDDKKLQEDLKDNTIITGGCIASMLLGEKINDYDLYFRSYELAVRVAHYYVNKFNGDVPKRWTAHYHGKKPFVEELTDIRGKARVRIIIRSAGVASESSEETDYRYFETQANDETNSDAFVEQVYEAEKEDTQAAETEAAESGKKKYRPVFLSSNAVTLTDKIQIVLRFWGNPEDIHNTYDFVHCTNYWDSKERRVVTNQAALECLLSRELRYVGSLYPVCSLVRTRKFVERGWKVNAGQFLKMSLQIAKLDLTDYLVLEDQLTGVDVAYFADLIAKAKANNAESVDSSYLAMLIDRMF